MVSFRFLFLFFMGFGSFRLFCSVYFVIWVTFGLVILCRLAWSGLCFRLIYVCVGLLMRVCFTC